MSMIMAKENFKEAFDVKWENCLAESENDTDTATTLFDETANAEEIVGFYLTFYNEAALKVWRENIEGTNLTDKDKVVTAILEAVAITSKATYKDRYIDAYEKHWRDCLRWNSYNKEEAWQSFLESAQADEIAGRYLANYGERALKTWLEEGKAPEELYRDVKSILEMVAA